MATKRNSFDGGTNTTVITEGNSGGGSGDALEYVSGSPTYSTTQAHSGTLAAAFPASANTSIGFELSASVFWVRFYAYLAQHVAHDLLSLWAAVNAGGSFLGGIATKVNGNLSLFSGGSSVDVSGAAITLNQWIRIEAMWSTTGGASIELYNSPDSTTPTTTASIASNLASAVATQELKRATVVTTISYFDDYAVSSDGPLGPAVDPVPRSAWIARTAVHRASRW
ncbi:hypothetical protein AB0L53_54750 [Nonomuraea sp. NPDC052129]|uniref:hypothetical protein n=1 Tax=Nonomuraea sp. NPDC052129 TaxID=3154651 RepID=UPI003420CBE0